MTPNQEQDQLRMQASMMGLLHRIATAAGGVLSIKLDEIPEQLPFNFRIESGKAIFTALEKPKTSLIQASSRTLNQLNGR